MIWRRRARQWIQGKLNQLNRFLRVRTLFAFWANTSETIFDHSISFGSLREQTGKTIKKKRHQRKNQMKLLLFVSFSARQRPKKLWMGWMLLMRPARAPSFIRRSRRWRRNWVVSQQDNFSHRESTHAELQWYQQLYSEEPCQSASLVAELDTWNQVILCSFAARKRNSLISPALWSRNILVVIAAFQNRVPSQLLEARSNCLHCLSWTRALWPHQHSTEPLRGHFHSESSSRTSTEQTWTSRIHRTHHRFVHNVK